MIQLEPGEKVITQVRQHWLVFIGQSFIFIVLAFAPVVVLILPNVLLMWNIVILAESTLWFFAASWWLLLWIGFSVVWTNYYLDLWVVTSKRIINIEQHTLFNREISECRLDRVQDITAEVAGFLPTMFGYGNVYIQTAAEAERFVMKNIPDPYGMKDMIFANHPPVTR